MHINDPYWSSADHDTYERRPGAPWMRFMTSNLPVIGDRFVNIKYATPGAASMYDYGIRPIDSNAYNGGDGTMVTGTSAHPVYWRYP